VVRRMEQEGLSWSVYGGGDPELVSRLRRLPRVRVRGYYRSGTLPHLLRRDGIDLALLLSVVPESYSLTLDECLSAGVPVVAFDLGAVSERLPRLGAGELVRLETGAEGVAHAVMGRLQ
jgi:glycosyltransferase involved in cell wall biosynthesis